jgi:putative FmdB family regulatory protein
MPIYEFYCSVCHRVFSFLSRSVDTRKVPACPRCGQPRLERRVSSFAISKRRAEDPAPATAPADFDESRLEQAMESMAGDLESVDENDPRQGARLMRRMFEASGMPVGAPMEEALRRMEAGEDPERIEQEMGDVLGGDDAGGEAAPEAGVTGRLARLRRRAPPSVDPELYEM